MDQREQTFLSALAAWEAAEERRIVAAEDYRVSHAKATAESTAKNAEGRKADADVATSAKRLERDRAELAATAAHHRLVFYRGSAGERSVG